MSADLHQDRPTLPQQADYWKERLSGELPILELPLDHFRPPVSSFIREKETRVLAEHLYQKLSAFCAQSNLPPYVVFLAALKILLVRYTGENDVIVGGLSCGLQCSGMFEEREDEGITYPVALRTDLSDDPTVSVILNRAAATVREAVVNAQHPFQTIMREVGIDDLSQPLPFKVMFDVEDLRDESLTARRTEAQLQVFQEYGVQCDCLLNIFTKEQCVVQVEYDAELFEPGTMTTLLRQFDTLLTGIITDSQQPLSSLSLFTQKERAAYEETRNIIQPTTPFEEFLQRETEHSIGHRFAQQVRRYPRHPALQSCSHYWTYEELEWHANQVAQALVKLDGPGESRVALLFDQGAPMVAALLGVLKAGKTYVPLNPLYPFDRLATLLQDVQADMLLTETDHMPLASSLLTDSRKILNWDAQIRHEPGESVSYEVSPDTLAYILYTSGSTGRPKGVMQSHRNVLRHIRTYTNSLHLCAKDRLTLFSSYGFDAAVMDIFGALLNGACLSVWDLRTQVNLSDFWNQLMEAQPTIYHSTPTVYRYLLKTGPSKRALATIRAVVLGGEEVLPQDVEMFQHLFAPPTLFVNGYGPTECTLALQNVLNHQSNFDQRGVPLGYPVGETEIVLVNEVGAPTELYGEIAIRNPAVAVGYWGDLTLTRQRFLSDPVHGIDRLYRTGDMGRRGVDGCWRFAGRKDGQVKLRGYRIEVGEIEVALHRHPQVQEAVVVAREDEPGEKRLVAYYVKTGEKSVVSREELRHHLQEKLPEYMVPGAYVELEALPLTSNGKVDRRALPAPESSRPESQDGFEAARNLLEEILAGIWAEVLKLNRVGVHQNFFELGGHSLLITQVVSRIRKCFGIEPDIRIFFQSPTVAGQAHAIQALLSEGGYGKNNEADEDIIKFLKQMDHLSADELEAMLERQLKEDSIEN